MISTSITHKKVDMVINQGSNILQVLSDNTITFLSFDKTPEIIWKYVNSIDNFDGTGDIIKAQQKLDFSPVLTELLVPTSGTNISSNVHVALGCFVKSSTTIKSNNCDKAFILSADISKNKASFSPLLSGFQQVNLDSVHAVVATDAKSFTIDDVIFGRVSDTQLLVLPLSSNKPITLDLPLSSPNLPDDEKYITDYKERQFKGSSKFIVTTSQGDLLPFVTHCTADSSKYKCDVFAIVTNPKPSILNVAQCIGRTTAIIGFERHLLHPHVAKSIICASVDSTSTSSTVVISNINLDNGFKPLITSSKLQLPNVAISSLAYVAAVKDGYSIFAEKSGQTFMLSQDKILWTRDEALSNVRQVLIIDGHSSIIDEENPSEMLDFWARLELQKVELFESFKNRIEWLRELPLELLEQFIPNYEKLMNFDFEAKKSTLKEVKAQKKISRDKKRELQRKGSGYTSKAIHFGFDKVALCLSSNIPLQGSSFLDASIRVSAVDLIKGDVLWSVEPALLPSGEKISIARLLKVGKSKNNVLLLSTESGNVYFFKIETPKHDGPLPTHKVISMTSKQSNKNSLVSLFALDGHSSRYLLLQKPDIASNTALVTVYPASKEDSSTEIIGKFLHHFDVVAGVFQTFVIDSKIDETTFYCKPLASLAFVPEVEKILSVTYPTLGDSIDSRFTILGDDSILLKYLNPHIALILTATNINDKSSSNETSTLYATVVDTISAKVIYRIAHESGSGPVNAVIVENSIVYTYWNSLAKRTELSSIALYEGMVERFGLNPIAYLKSTGAIQQLQRDAKVSAFSTPSPIGVQKTYVLPKSVSAIQHTVTSNGIANKNILVAFNNGQIYSLDMRMIHPRRPFGEPTLAEREEGLVQYNPFIHLVPLWAITLGIIIFLLTTYST